MKNNDEELPTTDIAQIERLIDRLRVARFKPSLFESLDSSHDLMGRSQGSAFGSTLGYILATYFRPLRGLIYEKYFR